MAPSPTMPGASAWTAMAMINLALAQTLARQIPAALPALYANNWELAAPATSIIGQASEVIDGFAHTIDVGIDARQDLFLECPRAARTSSPLHAGPSPCQRPASMSPTQGEAPRPEHRLSHTLRASLASPKHNTQALLQAVWPRVLHGLEFNPSHPATCHSYRTAAPVR